MEANIDNFINYTDSPSLFLCENFPELDFGFRSPETEISLTNNPPATTPSHSSDPSHQFSNVHSVRGPSSNTGSDHRSPDTMTSSPDDESRYMSTGTHISSNSKKIQKRSKEEKKARAKQEIEQLLATTARKYIPEGIDDPNLDDKTKRKMVQMVKNRVAAQKTRDKRKNYMSELEEVKSRLDEANRQLNERNRLLEQRVRDLECAQSRLMAENEELKRGSQFNTRSMQPQVVSSQQQQQMQHPMYQQQQIHHPNMQPPQSHVPHMQPMINSPHYPSLPSTPQHLMQPRFQSMASMGSFDGFTFPQPNTRLAPHPNNNNNNNSHTTITIESNDSQNNSNNSNGNGNQQFNTPFPVLSRGSSGKRNMYGYLLAITMVLACFTTLNIETGKIVTKGAPFADPEPSDPTGPSNPPTPSPAPEGDPNVGYGPDDATGTDTGGDGTGSGGTDTGTGTGSSGTDTSSGGNTGGNPRPGTESTNGNNDPTVQTDVATNNGTGTNGNDNGRRSPKKNEGSDDSGTGDEGTVNTLFTTDTDTDEGTDDGTKTNNGNTHGPIKFNTLDVDNNQTNSTNTTSTAPPSSILRAKTSIPTSNGSGRRMLTEIFDEIDALNRDY